MPSTRSPDRAPLAGRAAFLFDLDGTLVDSSAQHEAAFRVTLAASAPELEPRFDYRELKGLDTRAALRRLGVDGDERVARLAADKQAAYRALVARGEVRAFPMAAELLSWLRARGKLLILVTSAHRRSACAALDACGLAGLFAGMVTGDEVAHGKPHPALFDLAATRHAFAREAAMTVEDAPSGVAASLAAGIDAVVVHGPAPDPSIDSYADLGALYRALGGT
jgi:HAD superfamily hydrolase (TIGR01509 family)